MSSWHIPPPLFAVPIYDLGAASNSNAEIRWFDIIHSLSKEAQTLAWALIEMTPEEMTLLRDKGKKTKPNEQDTVRNTKIIDFGKSLGLTHTQARKARKEIKAALREYAHFDLTLEQEPYPIQYEE